MTRRLAEFEIGVQRATDLVGLGQSIGSLTNGLVSADDLYRAAIVQAVSALDYYMHGIIIDLSVEIITGRRPAGTDHRNIALPISAVGQILTAATAVDQEIAARTYVAQRLAKETLQNPDDIAKALSMVGIQRVWSTAFTGGLATTKTTLSLVVARRNRIVHQSDSDPLHGGIPTPILPQDALDSVRTVSDVAVTIDPLC